METPFTIHIALAGDHSLNLHALASLLRHQSRFRVVSISKDARQLRSSIVMGGQADYPHIVLLDINFDLHRAAGIISFLKGSYPDIRIAALGLTKDKAAIHRLRQIGIESYIPKNSQPEQLENTLTQIARDGNGTLVTEQPLGKYPPECEFESHPLAMKAWPSVSATERRFIRLAMSDGSDEHIRKRLNLPESTFATLQRRVYRQFGVSSRNGLVIALYRNRFMVMDDL